MIKAPPLRDALLEVRGTDWKTRQLHMSVPGSTSDLRDGGDLRDPRAGNDKTVACVPFVLSVPDDQAVSNH